MRLRSLFAAVFGLFSLAIVSPDRAAAFDLDRPDQPAGWERQRTIRHWVYHPNYRHFYLHSSATDPYLYQYRARGYYPYYNSMYWRPASQVHRARFRLPPYYAAWGSPKRRYQHVAWHRKHHGGHRRGDW